MPKTTKYFRQKRYSCRRV